MPGGGWPLMRLQSRGRPNLRFGWLKACAAVLATNGLFTSSLVTAGESGVETCAAGSCGEVHLEDEELRARPCSIRRLRWPLGHEEGLGASSTMLPMPDEPYVVTLPLDWNDKMAGLLQRRNLLEDMGNATCTPTRAGSKRRGSYEMTLEEYITEWLPRPVSKNAEENRYVFGEFGDQWEPLRKAYMLPPCAACLPRAAAITIGLGGHHSGAPWHFHNAAFVEVFHGEKYFVMLPPEDPVIPDIDAAMVNLSQYHWDLEARPLLEVGRLKQLQEKGFCLSYPVDDWLTKSKEYVQHRREMHEMDLSKSKDSAATYTRVDMLDSIAHAQECIVKPGELLYFPDNWLHGVVNLGHYTAFVSSFINRDLAGMETSACFKDVKPEMASIGDKSLKVEPNRKDLQKGIQRAAKRAVAAAATSKEPSDSAIDCVAAGAVAKYLEDPNSLWVLAFCILCRYDSLCGPGGKEGGGFHAAVPASVFETVEGTFGSPCVECFASPLLCQAEEGLGSTAARSWSWYGMADMFGVL
ncbi:unnamed protein product [Polarella glacialis]|uniref:JmjC domain-containing protein n=1 Tax=Polarella glacialis TaxID=89957 RepID=A0A813LD44_POLGL|nr:unnamed protein product [Polarella glacialis]